jgi:phosphonate transport system substrate-binding protein
MLGSVGSSDRHTKGTLAFGVVSSDPARRPWLKNACDLLSRRVGAVVYPQIARGYAELSDAMTSGSIDLAWAPPLIAADLVERRVSCVAAVSRRDNAAQYRAVIFARRDSTIRDVEELRDKRMAWVDRTSASGYVVPCAWLREHGFVPEQLFARQSFLGTHGAVARAVLRREVDAGATFALFAAGLRATVEAGWTEIDPSSADEIRVVVNAGTVPADCIIVSAGLSAELCARIEQAFLGLEGQDIAVVRRALGADGYARCPADHARLLRRLAFEASLALRRSLPPPSFESG